MEKSAKKKICFIHTISNSIKWFILPIIEELYRSNLFEIYIVCDYDETLLEILPNYVTYIPVKMKRGFSLNLIYPIIRLKKIFKKNHFDMIQYSTPNASFYSAIAGYFSNIKIRLYCQWGAVYVGYSGFKRFLLKTLERITCKLSTHIENDSLSNLTFFQKEHLFPKNKGSVIWNGSACGVDLNRFDCKKRDFLNSTLRNEYGISKDSFVFGFVGRITGDKGINELLYAFKNILSKDKKIFLLLVGELEKEKSLNPDLLNWAKNSRNVIFSGMQIETEKYYSAMNVLVLPSYREGFGLVAIEAQAMGIPVIVTDIPGPVDAIIPGVTGIVVKKKNVESLQKGMESTLAGYLSNRKNECSEFVKTNFDRDVFVKKVIKKRSKMLGIL